MCDMRFGTIECRGDGYLWDTDFDGYDPNDHSMTCPKCNSLQYLLDAKEDAESTSYYSNMLGSGSGVDIWEQSVKIVEYWNPSSLLQALKQIGKVEANFDADNEDGYDIKVFKY